MAKPTPRKEEPTVEVIAASSFTRVDGSHVHIGELLRVSEEEAAELKMLRIARDLLPGER